LGGRLSAAAAGTLNLRLKVVAELWIAEIWRVSRVQFLFPLIISRQWAVQYNTYILREMKAFSISDSNRIRSKVDPRRTPLKDERCNGFPFLGLSGPRTVTVCCTYKIPPSTRSVFAASMTPAETTERRPLATNGHFRLCRSPSSPR